MPDYNVTGLNTQQEQTLRQMIAAMAPTALPDRMIFLPGHQYSAVRNQVENGKFGNVNLGAGQGSDERYGRGHTIIGDAFSLVPNGLSYFNADLLKNPEHLRQTLAHELGHYHAAQTGGDASEETANKQRDVYVKRSKQAEQIWNKTQQLPVSTGGTPAVLSGMLQGVSQAIARHING